MNALRVNAERAGERQIIPFPAVSPTVPSLPQCPWCGRDYSPVRSNQVFCMRGHSREACERRKEEAIKALAAHFADYGLLERHVAMCAEIHWKRIRGVLEMLNYTYDEYEKQWTNKGAA